MSVGFQIVGPDGMPVVVDGVGAACVIDRGVPSTISPGDDPVILFRQAFTDDGTSSGSADMKVDGTAAGNQDFWIPADQEFDIYIRSVSWIIADGGSSLAEFAGLGAVLANGIRWFWSRASGEVDIHPAITKNLDLVRMSSVGFGDQANAFLAGGLSNIGAPVSGYMPLINLEALFGIKWGVRLRAGTKQKIVIRINDDLQTPEEIGAIGYGICRFGDP